MFSLFVAVDFNCFIGCGYFEYCFCISDPTSSRASQQCSGVAAAGLCGICSGCGLSRRLHSDGTAVYRHGPHGKPCSGSGKPPVTIADPTQLSGVSGTIGDSQVPPTISIDEPPVPSFRQSLPHVTGIGPTIKHIPRAARPACVVKLTELFGWCAGRSRQRNSVAQSAEFRRGMFYQNPLEEAKDAVLLHKSRKGVLRSKMIQ